MYLTLFMVLLAAVDEFCEGVALQTSSMIKLSEWYTTHYRVKHIMPSVLCLQCLTLLVGQQEGHPTCKKLRGGVLAWLSVWSKVQTCIWSSWCHCHSLSLASVKSRLVFTARCYASALLAMGLCLCPCLCLSVSVSVTSRSSTKTAKRRITQTTPHDSPVKIGDFRQITGYISKTVQDRRMVSIKIE